MRAVGGSVGGGSILLFLLLAPAAFAGAGLEPGVHVDPGSPAGKEYALPLSQARQTGGQGNGANAEGTLFGAGVKPPGGGPAAGAPGAARQGSIGSGAAAHAASEAAALAASSGPASPANALSAITLRDARLQPGGGGSSSLALIGGGIAVLVFGAFGGTVLRRTRRPGPGSPA